MNKKQIAKFVQALVDAVVKTADVTDVEARTIVGLELRGVREAVLAAALTKCGKTAPATV